MSTASRLHAAVFATAVVAATWLACGSVAMAQGRDEPVAAQQVIVVGKRVEQRFPPVQAEREPAAAEMPAQQVIVTGQRLRSDVAAIAMPPVQH